MLAISLLGVILVVAGLALSFPSLSNKINVKTTTGWAIAAIGMLIISFCAFVARDFVFASISLMFAIGDLYCCTKD